MTLVLPTAQSRRLRLLARHVSPADAAVDELARNDRSGDPGGGDGTSIVLRPLELSDYQALSALNANVFAKPYPERVEQWLSSIPRESWDTLCAFAPDGQLVCSFWYEWPAAHNLASF